MFASWQKAMTNLNSVLKSRDITLLTTVHRVKAMVFCHIRLWELDHKEDGELKNWCIWTVVLEKTPEGPLDSKEIKPVNLKGKQPLILIGKTNDEAETPVFWSSDANNWLIGKVIFQCWKKCWERLRAEGEEGIRGWDGWMASSMQWTWTWANSGRRWGTQRLACCSPWGRKELDMTEQLNNNKRSVKPKIQKISLWSCKEKENAKEK